ncbi:MAG: hypothetical protein ABSH41_29225, partial [Syntrophobacteraceae bacterium]
TDAAILAKSGALDSISGAFNRPQILWFIAAWLNRFDAPNNTQSRSGPSHYPQAPPKAAPALAAAPPPLPASRAPLLASFSRSQITAFHSRSPIQVPALPDFSERRKWAHEFETLGFLLSVHPLELAEPFFRSLRQPLLAASDMAAHVGKKIRMKGWPVTRKEVVTREGEEMEFFTFEDKTGIFETVFFPKPFRRFCQDLDMSHAYLLHGLVESEFDVVSLNVDYAYRVQM